MRPRPDATENVSILVRCEAGTDASMRPRPDATENVVRQVGELLGIGRFNEAAARCHGKPDRALLLARGRPASMRPRPDATENLDNRDGARMRELLLQ